MTPNGQKLGIILENKVVQKVKLENNDFTKKWSPKLIFLNEKKIEKIWLIFFPFEYVDSWPKSCFLGPTILEIPQPN